MMNVLKSLSPAVNRRHYANIFMQYAAIFKGCKNDNFYMEKIVFEYFCSKQRLWVPMYTTILLYKSGV